MARFPVMPAPAVMLALGLFIVARADEAIKRFSGNPLIDFSALPMSCDEQYNIQFPSVLAAPKWLKPRLGAYYMYFADHRGRYISLSYADHLKGPWTVYAPPTLTLAQVFAANNDSYNATGLSYKAELSAPDVHIEAHDRILRMYFKHRIPSTGYDIVSAVATSADGIHWSPRPGFIGEPYVRGFQWRGDVHGYYYLIDRRGNMLRSPNGYTAWEMGNNATAVAFVNQTLVDQFNDGNTGYVRHVGVGIIGDTLYMFGSRIGDSPERILWATMHLDCLNHDWLACATDGPAQNFMRPELPYEGAGYPLAPSVKGDAIHVNQLRDPYPYFDEDEGHFYLYYTIAGESGIAGARIPSRFLFQSCATAVRAK